LFLLTGVPDTAGGTGGWKVANRVAPPQQVLWPRVNIRFECQILSMFIRIRPWLN
jgi:hypothetical protein